MRSVISILFSGLLSESKLPVHQMQAEAPKGSPSFERGLEVVGKTYHHLCRVRTRRLPEVQEVL